MAEYGRFETVREFASSGPFSVWTARERGVGEPTAAVKILTLAAGLFDETVLKRRAADFESSLSVQRAVAASGGKAWAPVLDMGRTPEAVWAAMPLYPSSVAKVVDRKAELDIRTIAWMTRGCIAGLRELRDLPGAGRGHGALRGSNVMLDADRPEPGTGVFLTDPAPSQKVGERTYAEDLVGLGGLVFQLVAHRPPPAAGSVGAGPEWSRLGRGGEALRVLCEQLLNAQRGPDLTLERIEEMLGGVEAAGRKKAPVAAIAGVAVVLLALGGGAAWYLTTQGGGQQPGVVDQGPPDPRAPNAERWLVAEIDAARAGIDEVEQQERSLDAAAVKRAGVLRNKLQAEVDAIAQVRAEDWERVAEETGLRERTEAERAELTARVEERRAELAQVQTDIDQWKAQLRGEKVEIAADPRVPLTGWQRLDEERLAALWANNAEGLRNDPGLKDSIGALEQAQSAALEEVRAVRELPWPEDPEARTALDTRIKAAESALYATLARVGAEVRDSRDRLRQERADRETANREGTIVSLLPLREAVASFFARVDVEAGWAVVLPQLESIESWARAIESGLPADDGVEVAAGSRVDVGVIERAYDTARTAAAAELATQTSPEMAGSELSEAIGRQAAGLKSWRDGASALAAGAMAIERLLSEGRLPDESGGGAGAAARSIEDLRGSLRSSELFASIGGSVEPVLRLLDPVDAAARAESVDAAKAALVGAEGPAKATTVRVAWERMKALGYPSTPAAIADAAGVLRDQVLPRVSEIAPVSRREAIEADLRTGLREMWLSVAHERTGSEPAAVATLFGAMEAAGVDEATVARLEPWARANLARWRFISDVEAFDVGPGQPKEQAERLKGVFDRLRDRLAGIEGTDLVREREGWVELERKLRPFREGKTLELDREGPARAGWTANPLDQEGAAVEYTLTKGRNVFKLTFDRVMMDTQNDTARYVSRTEMTVGLFSELVVAPGPIDAVKNGDTGILYAEEGVFDRRSGPVTWIWVGPRLMPSLPTPDRMLANGWHIQEQAIGRADYYPEGLTPPPPSRDHPMAYVSVQGAVLAALRAGCRLPTVEEWDAARQMPRRVQGENVRDATWRRQFDHIVGLQRRVLNLAQWPDGDTYAAPFPGNGAVVIEGDDGSLWSRPVPANPAGPADVEGNVAEFVIRGDPSAMDAAAGRSADWNPASLRGAMEGLGEFGVVGRSAISGPDWQADRVLELEFKKAANLPYGYDPRGYSDVGIRLAFTTGVGAGGSGPPKDRLLKALRETPYLTRAD